MQQKEKEQTRNKEMIGLVEDFINKLSPKKEESPKQTKEIT